MREKKKALKLNKSVIAKFKAFQLSGGTDSFPCQANTGAPSAECPTGEDITCRTSEQLFPSDCTKGQYLSDQDIAECRG